MKKDEWIEIGHVADAHGIRGMLRIHSYCEDETIFSRIPDVRVKSSRGHDLICGIHSFRRHGRSILMNLKAISDRNQAEELVGAKLYCRKAYLPRLEGDDYYWIDLVGLNVYTTENECLGLLSSIIPTAGNDVFVVTQNDREILIPAIESVIQEIDLDANRMRVKLPDGLRE